MCQIKCFPVANAPTIDGDVLAKVVASGPLVDRARLVKKSSTLKKVRTLRKKKKRLVRKTKVTRVSLTQACRGGDLATVKAHLALGDHDVNERVPQIEYTPLHYAVFYGHLAIVELLMAAGAAVDAKTSTGLAPLHIAVDHGTPEMCQTLLEGCANPSVVDDKGCTALHRAVALGRLEIVELLLQFSLEEDYAPFINVNCFSKDGVTPLVTAVTRKHAEAVSMLLDFKADVTLSTVAGDPPLAVAIRKKDIAVVRLLLNAGADPLTTDENGMSPIDWAEEMDNLEILDVLRQKLIDS